MMGGGAFILLKTGRAGPESAKQAEIRLAILLKILRIGRPEGENLLAGAGKDMRMVVICGNFRGIWLIRPKLSHFVI